MRRAIVAAGLALLAACGDSQEGTTSSGGSPPGVIPDPSVPPPPPPGPDPFDDTRLTTYEITLDPADWNAMVADPHDNTWRRCSVRWQGELYLDVGIRPSGDRSRIPGNPKPSLRLEFDEFILDREFHGFSTLKLDAVIHDASMMRSRLQYPVYVMRGVPAPRYVHGRVLVNGEYKGLYGVEERVGKEFCRKRFGRPVQQLYEWGRSSTMYDLIWTGWDPITNYVPRMWVPTIEELPSGDEFVRQMIYALNNDLSLLPPLFDVDRFLNYMAAETLTGEGDAYVAGRDGERTANIWMYHSPISGQLTFIPWDRDQGFWQVDMGITHGFENRVLTRNLILDVPANLARYKQILRELIEGPYRTVPMQARVDSIADQIRQAAYEDVLKRYSNEEFEWFILHIKDYIAERNAAFLQQVLSP
jgi:hypothetical protein